MHISVNIRRMKDHMALLHQQQREAEALIDCLISLAKQAAETGVPDLRLVDRHLRIARNHAENVRRRIALLDSMSEELLDLTRTVNRTLTDAQDMAATASTDF